MKKIANSINPDKEFYSIPLILQYKSTNRTLPNMLKKHCYRKFYIIYFSCHVFVNACPIRRLLRESVLHLDEIDDMVSGVFVQIRFDNLDEIIK